MRIVWVASVFLTSVAFGQTDFEQLKVTFLQHRKLQNQDSAMFVAKKMTNIALVEQGDSSYWYAMGLRFQGNVFKTNKEYDSLTTYWNKSISIFEKFHPTNPDHADVLNAMALYHYEKGSYASAVQIAERSLAVRESYSKDDNQDYADFLNNMAVFYMASRINDKAESSYVRALEMYERLYGKKHSTYVSTLNNLARLYDRVGNDVRAEKLYLEVLNIKSEMNGESHMETTIAKKNLGIFYYYRGKFQDAEKLFTENLNTLRQTSGEQSVEYASALETLGAVNWKTGRYTEAEGYYILCAEIRKQKLGIKHPDYASVIQNLAVLKAEVGDFLSAEKYYLEAADIKRVVLGENHVDYALILHNLGNHYGTMGKLQLAQNNLEKALEIRRKNVGEHHELCALTLNSLAVIFLRMAKYEEAERNLLQAGEIYSQFGGNKNPEFGNHLNNLGLLYTTTGDFAKAEKYLREAMQCREKLFGKIHAEYANSVNNLGNVFYESEQYAEAERCYQETAEIRRKLFGEQHPSYAESLVSLGRLYADKGDLEKSEHCYKLSCDIRKKKYGEQHPEYAVSLNNLGLFYKEIGSYYFAATYLVKALEINLEVYGDDHPAVADILNNLGLLYGAIGNYESADTCYQRALLIRQLTFGKDNLECAQLFLNLGNVKADNDKHADAIAYYKQALDIYEHHLGEKSAKHAMVLHNIGRSCMYLQQYDRADSCFSLAIQFTREKFDEQHPDVLRYEGNMAMLKGLSGLNKEAFDLYEKGLENRTRYVAENFEWLAEKERETFWKGQEFFFRQLSGFAVQNYESDVRTAGLLYNEALVNKGKLLESHVTRGEEAKAYQDERTELTVLRRRINKMESDGTESKEKLRLLKFQADSLDRELTKKWSDYNEQHQHFQISWKQIQTRLQEKQAAIEFVRYQEMNSKSFGYVALVLRKSDTEPILVKLCGENELEGLNNKLNIPDFYRLIWKPLETHLQGMETIYYSPTGLLNHLPFHALYDDEHNEATVSSTDLANRGVVGGGVATEASENVQYVMDTYHLHQMLSTRNLLTKETGHRESVTNPSLLLLGGIDYNALPATNQVTTQTKTKKRNHTRSAVMDGSGLEYLPGTLDEVNRISKMADQKGWNHITLTGRTATEEGFVTVAQTRHPHIIHVATHGFAFDQPQQKKEAVTKQIFRSHENPMVRSGLVLSGGNWAWLGSDTLQRSGASENGVLTALEVTHLDLSQTDLVVLSACETGLGKVEGGEGTFGLMRGFKQAGVNKIVMSLWAVPDKETMELMNSFYDEFSKRNNTEQAFHAAQKSMRERYPQRPDLWAAFVLVR